MEKNQHEQHGGNILLYFRQIRRIMRLSVFFMVLGTALAFSATTYSQSTKLSVNLKDATVREVIKAIEDQSEFLFLYQEGEVDLNRRVTIQAEGKQLQEILDEIFKGTDNIYIVSDRQVVIGKAPRKTLEAQLTVLQKELKTVIDQPQQKEITGKVTDASGEPVPGATVLVKGTTIGTVTDADGNFSLRIPANAQTLQISFVGMKTVELPIGNLTTFNVVLEEEAIGLQEVVAVGYGTMRKSDITGAISSVPMKLIKDQPLTGVNDLLQGRVAGMTLIKSSGDIAATIKNRIRGPNSIKGDNSPLYVVDGVIGGSYGSAYDIESIEVLKDASATAIYGERGSNGVILITTKKATSAEPKIRIQLNTGYRTQNVNYPDKMNAAEYAEHVNDLRESEIYSADEIENFRKNGGTNWTDLVMQSGIIQDYYITYSQKVDKLGVYLSGRYNEADGVLVNSKSGGNYGLRSKVTFEPSKRLSFVLDLNASKSKRKNGGLSTGNDKTDPIFQSLIWSPTEPVWEDEENGIYNLQDHYGSLSENPYKTAMEQNNLVMSHNISTMLIADLKIMDWLSYNVTGYATKSASQNATYENKWINPTDPQASRSSNDSFQWRLINSININKSFNYAHNVLFTGVYEAEAGESWYVGGSGRNMPLPDLAQYYKIDMSNIQSASSSFGEWSRIGWLARLNYNYLSRYYFTASYRLDAQSGPKDRSEENKYGGFPSFALGWRLSEEPFLKDKIFDNLKLRVGWGITGNPCGFPYATMTKESYNFGLGSEVLGYRPGTPANYKLKWEETSQTDFGLDITILNDKLSLIFDYFYKKTDDLLTEKYLPGYFGYGEGASYTQNLGRVVNRGYEVTLDFTPIQTSSFYWGLNFNISTVKNKVVDLGEQEAFLTGTDGHGLIDFKTYRIEEGLPMGTMWGYKFLGIWGSEEAAEAAKFGNQPGDPKFEDLNKDYSIDLQNDGQKIGDANPDFTWGFSSVFTYKDFDFSILLQGMHGQDVFNLARGVMSSIHPESRTITLREPAFNYWTPENQNTLWPNIHSASGQKRLNTSQWIEDGSWVKVRQIGLTYHLPKKLISFGDLSLSVNGNDLLTFSKYKGFDPEVSSSGNSDVYGGCDFGTVPIPKTVTFSVILDF